MLYKEIRMFKSFSELKAGRGSFDDLQKELDKMSKSGFQQDDDKTYWRPVTDKAGNGFALIRFMCAPAEETAPFVRYWQHGFKGPTNKWYIERSRTTINEADPVAELNSELWNSSTEDNSPARKQVRVQKRKLYY